MAEAGHVMSELFPQGSTTQSDFAIANDIIIPLSKSSAELVKDHIKPEELEKSFSEVPCSANIAEDGDHVKAKATVDIRTAADECLPVCSAEQPHSIADVYKSNKTDGQKGDGLNHENDQASLATMASLHRDYREEKLALTEVSVQRSQSDNLQIQQRDLTPVIHCDSSEPVCPGTNQKSPIPSLVCKQAMQPQNSSATIFCKAGSISSSQQSCMQTCPAIPAHVSGHSRFEEVACCSPYHHGAAEDTFAAYCHPQPIPAPAQFLPRLTSIERDLKGPKGGPAFLALPPLISSISETRLDAKRLSHCCSLDCNWPGSLHQAGRQAGRKESINMRDAGTMTSCTELRDMAVQVGQPDSETSSQHVYPEVCLVDEREDGNHKLSAQHKSPVKEVKWDAEGMTWEVYGASVDPEELGLAIQRHLELQIKETAGKAVMISQQNQNTSQPGREKSQKRRRGVMAALRRPSVCCSRSTTAAD